MSGVRVTFARCWECMYGHHYDPPAWHPWADDEDVIAAVATGQGDPSDETCDCACSGGPVVKGVTNE
jgi:hypothetical protein